MYNDTHFFIMLLEFSKFYKNKIYYFYNQKVSSIKLKIETTQGKHLENFWCYCLELILINRHNLKNNNTFMFYISKVPIIHPLGHFIKTVEY